MLFLLKLTPTKLQFIITSLNHNGSPIVQWKYRLKKKSLKFLIILPVFYLLKFKNCIKTHKNINFTKMRQNKRNMKLMSASFKKLQTLLACVNNTRLCYGLHFINTKYNKYSSFKKICYWFIIILTEQNKACQFWNHCIMYLW